MYTQYIPKKPKIPMSYLYVETIIMNKNDSLYKANVIMSKSH